MVITKVMATLVQPGLTIRGGKVMIPLPGQEIRDYQLLEIKHD
jgi:hypothetical protein